jgi:hypothetical protein
MADRLIAVQLGHKDTTLIATRYGRFTLDGSVVRAGAKSQVFPPTRQTAGHKGIEIAGSDGMEVTQHQQLAPVAQVDRAAVS